jgi:hypothetical protein
MTSQISSGRAETSGSITPKAIGLFTRTTRWGLSWRGWVLIAAIGLLGAVLTVANIYSFLAVTNRVGADTLVVEGWIDEFAMQTAVNEFRSGGYRHLCTTGGPVRGSGGYINDYQTAASVGAGLLKKLGIPSESVQIVPSHVIGRNRTYSCAVAASMS